MLIIKKSKLKKMKAYKKACKRIYELITESKEDEHGNVKSYKNDKINAEILKILENVGIGEKKSNIVGISDWEYQLPFPVPIRK